MPWVAIALEVLGRWIAWFLLRYGGSIVGNILVYFGIRMVSAKVTNTFMHSTFASLFAGVPQQLAAVLSYIRADVAVSIILSAAVYRAVKDGALRFALRGAPGT